MGVSQSFGGRRQHGQFQLGNRGTKAKCLREQGKKKVLGNVNTGTKHSFVTGRTKRGEKRRNRHLSCDVFFSFSQSVFMELRQRLNWGMSICYESTLGNWMLSKINNNIGGKQEHSEITVTTYYPGGRSRGGSVKAPTPQVDNSPPTLS